MDSFGNEDAVQLCRDRIEVSGDVTLGIHSNVAGDGYDFTAGHAWVSVQTPSSILYLGLWPDGHPRVVDRRAECSDVRINMELGATPMVSRFYKLSPGQLLRLNAVINRPDVWGYTNNCSNWAVKVMHEVLGSHISASDYLFFSTPRELGKELRALEQLSPTSPINPVFGEFQEQSTWSSW